MKINLTYLWNILCVTLALFSLNVLENQTLFSVTRFMTIGLLLFMVVLATISLGFVLTLLKDYKKRQKVTFTNDEKHSSWKVRVLTLVFEIALIVIFVKGSYHERLLWVEGLMIYKILVSQTFAWLHYKARNK